MVDLDGPDENPPSLGEPGVRAPAPRARRLAGRRRAAQRLLRKYAKRRVLNSKASEVQNSKLQVLSRSFVKKMQLGLQCYARWQACPGTLQNTLQCQQEIH